VRHGLASVAATVVGELGGGGELGAGDGRWGCGGYGGVGGAGAGLSRVGAGVVVSHGENRIGIGARVPRDGEAAVVLGGGGAGGGGVGTGARARPCRRRRMAG
jgi:hypothetical protein